MEPLFAHAFGIKPDELYRMSPRRISAFVEFANKHGCGCMGSGARD